MVYLVIRPLYSKMMMKKNFDRFWQYWEFEYTWTILGDHVGQVLPPWHNGYIRKPRTNFTQNIFKTRLHVYLAKLFNFENFDFQKKIWAFYFYHTRIVFLLIFLCSLFDFSQENTILNKKDDFLKKYSWRIWHLIPV